MARILALALLALLASGSVHRVLGNPGAAASEPPALTPLELGELVQRVVRSERRDPAELTRLLAAGAAVRPRLLALILSPEWKERWNTVNALGHLGDTEAIPALVDRVLRDPSSHVRRRSLWAIGNIERGGATARAIFARELVSSIPEVRWNATVGLSYFDDPRCLPRLPDGLASRETFVRFEAVYGFQSVHDEATSGRLEPVLAGDPDRVVRRQVVQTLAYLCDEKAKELLARALTDPDRDLRWWAASGLARCGDATYQGALTARAREETDDGVCASIEQAARHLGSAEPEAGPARR